MSVKDQSTLVPSLQKQPSFFAPGPSGVSREGRLRFTAKNSILINDISVNFISLNKLSFAITKGLCQAANVLHSHKCTSYASNFRQSILEIPVTDEIHMESMEDQKHGLD